MLDTLQTIGATFYPLRDADDAACLMEAAARAPAATPRRAERIVEFLASSLQMVTATSCQVMQFFSKVHGHGLFDAVVSSIPDSDGQIIVTDRTCIVCGEALEEAVNDHGKSFGASPSLFTGWSRALDAYLASLQSVQGTPLLLIRSRWRPSPPWHCPSLPRLVRCEIHSRDRALGL